MTGDTLASTPDGAYRVRNTRPEDFPGIAELSRRAYPDVPPWTEAELAQHLRQFPEGQLVAVTAAPEEGRPAEAVVGMAAGLRVRWTDYEVDQSWLEFTARGTFRNHDPEGPILYGAEVMVHPDHRRRGVGSALYDAREELVFRLGLRAIRAGSRLRGYGRVAGEMSAREYVERVEEGDLADPTLSFQLARGFRVLSVVEDYLRRDPESLGWAAVVEWRNPDAD